MGILRWTDQFLSLSDRAIYHRPRWADFHHCLGLVGEIAFIPLSEKELIPSWSWRDIFQTVSRVRPKSTVLSCLQSDTIFPACLAWNRQPANTRDLRLFVSKAFEQLPSSCVFFHSKICSALIFILGYTLSHTRAPGRAIFCTYLRRDCVDTAGLNILLTAIFEVQYWGICRF